MMLSAVPAWICVDRDDGALDRVDDARDDVLQPADDLRGRRHRVDRLVRRGPVAALAADLDLEHVAGGGVRSRQDADLAERVEREEMRADHHVDAVHDAGLDELTRAARPELLGVLEDEPDLAVEFIAPLVQRVQRREQHRRVAVVAARVHDAGILGGELEAGLLLDRQRVDIRAQRQRLPRPPGTERGDEARLRRPVELEPFHAAEQLEEERRGLVLLEAQLRVLMEVPPPRDRLRFQLWCDERAHSESSEKSAMEPTLSRTSASRPSRFAFSCSFSCITSTSSKKRWTVGASSSAAAIAAVRS